MSKFMYKDTEELRILRSLGIQLYKQAKDLGYRKPIIEIHTNSKGSKLKIFNFAWSANNSTIYINDDGDIIILDGDVFNKEIKIPLSNPKCFDEVKKVYSDE